MIRTIGGLVWAGILSTLLFIIIFIPLIEIILPRMNEFHFINAENWVNEILSVQLGVPILLITALVLALLTLFTQR